MSVGRWTHYHPIEDRSCYSDFEILRKIKEAVAKTKNPDLEFLLGGRGVLFTTQGTDFTDRMKGIPFKHEPSHSEFIHVLRALRGSPRSTWF